MTWLDPWPQTPEEVRRWKITDPYDRYFTKRADVIAELFEENPASIDGIALAMVSLNALAYYRYTSKAVNDRVRGTGKDDQSRFRRLVTEYCKASFENRMSIPELLLAMKKRPSLKSSEDNVRNRYPVIGMSFARQPSEDPLIKDFEAWAVEQQLVLPDDFPACDYAGCIHRHYRNSVVHQLRIANGKEAGYFGEAAHSTPIYYTNYGGRLGIKPEETDAERLKRWMDADPVDDKRFGVKPMYLLQLLREAIASLRQWSLDNDRHIFPEDD